VDPFDSSIARFSFEGDIEAAREQIGTGRKLLADLLQRMKLAGLQTGAIARPMGEDGYIYVRVNGGVSAVRIVAGNVIGQTQERPVSLGAPDFVSGVVTDGRLLSKPDPTEGRKIHHVAKFYPTPQASVTHTDLVADQAQGMERLAVEPHSDFPELAAPESSRYAFTQYAKLRPTMYSGTMKRVIQALMGFGRQLPRENQKQTENDPVEDDGDSINLSRTRSIYAKVFDDLLGSSNARKARKPTTYEKAVATAGLQICYDYRFMRTHGIHVAVDGVLWLVEISMARGVIAMPLPLHPLTARPMPPKAGEPSDRWRFREALEKLRIGINRGDPVEMRDEDGLRILDEFGGFPTGESFPSERAIVDAMIRAGELLELLKPADLQPFYDHSFYSSAMGWAFSESGREAHNTAYRYTDEGVQKGVHYAINLAISATRLTGAAEGAAAIRDRVRAASVNIENGTERRPILERKAMRLSAAQVLELNRIADHAEFVARLDEITVAPIATGSANIRLQREGYLINPGTRPAYQIKYHEPLLGYLLSHDFQPDLAGRTVRKFCDTTMHVFWDGEELKWVRYFYDPNATAPGTDIDDDYEECMLVGSWTRTTTTGARAVTRGYYTGDYDDRQTLGESETITRIKSEYIGATTVRVADDPADFRRNEATRTHTFKKFSDVTRESGQDILTAIAVPNGSREAYYMAFMRYAESYSRTQSYQYVQQGDKYWAEGWRCIISTAGFAYWPSDMRECPPGCDTRINYAGYQGTINNPRVARYVFEQDFPCVDFTDKGPWVKKCDNLDALVYHIPLPTLPATITEDVPRKAHLEVRLVLGGEPRQRVVHARDYRDSSWVYPMWFVPSPDPDTGIEQFIACTFSTLGDRPSAAYDTDINNGSDRYGSPAYSTMGGSNTCYLGVI
jgi:hypothetical protein